MQASVTIPTRDNNLCCVPVKLHVALLGENTCVFNIGWVIKIISWLFAGIGGGGGGGGEGCRCTELFHIFLGNNQNYHPLSAVDDLMHCYCCPRLHVLLLIMVIWWFLNYKTPQKQSTYLFHCLFLQWDCSPAQSTGTLDPSQRDQALKYMA